MLVRQEYQIDLNCVHCLVPQCCYSSSRSASLLSPKKQEEFIDSRSKIQQTHRHRIYKASSCLWATTYGKYYKMFVSKNDRPWDESWTGQVYDQAGHCPLTGRYCFGPCTRNESLWMQQFTQFIQLLLLCNFGKIDFLRRGCHYTHIALSWMYRWPKLTLRGKGVM